MVKEGTLTLTFVDNVLTGVENVGCNITIKLYCLFLHLDWFPGNLGSFIYEQGEITSRHERDRNQVSISVECNHGG